jgi:hypothetical protein
VRLLPAAAAVAGALWVASAGVGGAFLAGDLSDYRGEFGDMSRREAEHEAGRHHGFEPAVWDFLRRHVRAGERYAVVTPGGRPRGFTNEGAVTRTYAAFWLLPAVQVERPRDADVVVYVGVRPGGEATCVPGRPRACVSRRGS